MRTRVETKKAMRQALKAQLAALSIPGLASKKASTQMQLSAVHESGCEIVLACAEVSGGRPTGHFGLYWILSLKRGPIYQAMVDTGLDSAKGAWSGDVFHAVTSHNLTKPSHHEVGPDTDVAAAAASIREQMERIALPLARAFTSEPNAAIDLLLGDSARRTRNPFTTAVILAHLAGRTDRLPDLLAAASTRPTFLDFHQRADPAREIVEPIERWFSERARGR